MFTELPKWISKNRERRFSRSVRLLLSW